MRRTAKPQPAAPQTPLRAFTAHELRLLSYHLRVLATDPPGRYSMAVHADAPIAEIVIEPRRFGDDPIWDQISINGHWCGNRCGGTEAYARLMAGDPDWYRP